ncbi:hypothetical protein SG34_000185 [Thalassomonas viridans]|uniref:DUF4402 domain-containing protein n=1 Tax=Thalassomonas viridans TaxID=137584 RepID=A0AAE9Z242_9GAMM|nr:hypothetical protein [Thalassomonas viridans]WDE05406.1 hypothetical protein SG34_000185 [Thalassomonas viridans]
MKISLFLLGLVLFAGEVAAGDVVYVNGARHSLETSDFTDPTPGSIGVQRYYKNLEVIGGEAGGELIFDIDLRVNGGGVYNSQLPMYHYKVNLMALCNSTFVGTDNAEAYLFEANSEMKLFTNRLVTFGSGCNKVTLMATVWMEDSELELNISIAEPF